MACQQHIERPALEDALPAGVVVSLGSVFIENADAVDATGKSAEQLRQDCELKAAQRPLLRIKKKHPRFRFVLAVDNLYACGAAFALTLQLNWSHVVTFQEGRRPALWQENGVCCRRVRRTL